MKTLLFVLFALVLPSASLAQDHLNRSGPSVPRSATAPDIFHFRAHTCTVAATDCGPDNIVPGSSFAALIDVFVPVTQGYTRYYIVTDIEGNTVAFDLAASTLTGGTRTQLTFNFALPAGGLFKFISIVQGADGRLAFSDAYRFRTF